MAGLSLFLLGGFEVRLDNVPLSGIKTDKARALLTYLVVEKVRPHRRQALAGLLWPAYLESSARANLRNVLTNLRQVLSDEGSKHPFLLIEGETIQLNPQADVWVDVWEFNKAIDGEFHRREQRSTTGDQRTENTNQQSKIDNLKSAISLYRSSFLEGFSLPDSPEFDTWLSIEREALHRQALNVLYQLGEAYEKQGELENVCVYASRQIELEPWCEQAHQQLMRALSLKGARAQALAQFESLKKELQRELNVEPSEDTLQLYQQIREGMLQARKKEAAVTDEPPTRPGVKKPHHNLPIQLTSFIGREKEIDAVTHLLQTARLVTLTGPGGTGKTRLALQTAAGLVDQFADGVWLVELAPLADPALISSTVAALFGWSREGSKSLLDILSDNFRSKRLLLILDNCEHLIQEAAQFAEAVLLKAPEVKILATSRESLGSAGETMYLVSPLETPDHLHLPPIQTLAAFEAVRLFTERACTVLPAFTLTEITAPVVAHICHRLDGIPLAIELAAARIKVLSTEQITAHLDDRFRLLTGGSRTAVPRHQTLYALIDWSYGLLSEPERVLFRRLTVFRGGWTLEAAETVCSWGGQTEIEVLDLLAGLVNKSLVSVEMKAGEVQRYSLLETIRQFAQEKLMEAREEAQLRDRHLEYFVTFAEAMEEKLHSPAYLEALEQFDDEIDNHRLALEWALGVGGSRAPGGSGTSSGSRTSRQNMRVADGLRLANAMGTYWETNGLYQEGYDWCRRGLAIPLEEDEHTRAIRARAYYLAGFVGDRYISQSMRQQLYSESVALYRQCDDRFGLALALIYYGGILSDTMPSAPHPVDYASGIALIEEGLAILEELGDPTALANIFRAKARIAYKQRDFDTARKMYQMSAAFFEQSGDIFRSERLKFDEAIAAIYSRDFRTARRLLEHHLEFGRKINRKNIIVYSIQFLGWAAYLQEDFAQSETFFQEALVINKELGISEGVHWITHMLGCINLHLGQIPNARQFFMESMSLEWRVHPGEAYGSPGDDLAFVVWMGSIAESQGNLVLAGRFLGAVEAVLETFFKPQELPEQIEYNRLTAKLRASLDEATLTAAWAEGRKLTLKQALEEALAFCRQDSVENAKGV